MSLLTMPLLIAMLCVGSWLAFKVLYRVSEHNTALIVRSIGNSNPRVHFVGAWVVPGIHRVSIMALSVVILCVHRRGKNALVLKDGSRADISMAFYLRVDTCEASVLHVMKTVGIKGASDPAWLEQLFYTALNDALTAVGKTVSLATLHQHRDLVFERFDEALRQPLEGYVLEDITIDYLASPAFERV